MLISEQDSWINKNEASVKQGLTDTNTVNRIIAGITGDDSHTRQASNDIRVCGDVVVRTILTCEDTFVFTRYTYGQSKLYRMRVQGVMGDITEIDTLSYQAVVTLIYSVYYYSLKMTEVWRSIKFLGGGVGGSLFIQNFDAVTAIQNEMPAWQNLISKNYVKDSKNHIPTIKKQWQQVDSEKDVKDSQVSAECYILDYIAAAFHIARRQLHTILVDQLQSNSQHMPLSRSRDIKQLMDDCVTVVDQFDLAATKQSDKGLSNLQTDAYTCHESGEPLHSNSQAIYTAHKRSLHKQYDRLRLQLIDMHHRLADSMRGLDSDAGRLDMVDVNEAFGEANRQAIFVMKRLHERLYWRWIHLIKPKLEC